MASDAEKTYRIFFEELPPLVKAEVPGASVRILTKMGIPIFVMPVKSRSDAAIQAAAVSGGKVTFDVQNRGNVHFSVQGVKVSGFGADGARLFDRQLEGWYVLPGVPRSYEVEIPKDVCSKVKRLEVEALTDIAAPQFGTLNARIDGVQAACSSGN
jgi:fimbrial chaperone protein